MKPTSAIMAHNPNQRFGYIDLVAALLKFARRHSIWLYFLALFIFFSFENANFLSVSNLSNILENASFLGLLSIGMTFVMITGGIDLTVGAVLGLAACLCIGLQGYGLVFSIAAALFVGTALGLVNGLVVAKAGVHSFIVTLGGLIGIRGLVFLYTGQHSLTTTNIKFMELGMASIGPISLIVLIFLVVFLFSVWLLYYSVYGRNAYAIGGNIEAAANAGIAVGRHTIMTFGLSGFLAALAGVCMAAEMDSATPTLGHNYELWTIIAVVLGGTKLEGGTGGLVGTLGGLATLAILRNGMSLMNVQPFYVLLVLGSVLVLALLIERQIGRRQGGVGV